ncbi:carbohydrate ABC transporter permease [Actinospica durhamensis]|uniref:Carbohydrate ABC transporter permease n=1 Tax=Actinospica durhamensis TaxID=1508375 RepID=A0A941IU85_9ACTN|nr:carbohydrate ABC transporter permease [Actinospica durhamensis]MBR7837088.1 carbohydrate ABC transporter permease [Actinospica durhamensis]
MTTESLPVAAARPARRRRIRIGRSTAWVLLILALVLTLFPFYWMIRTALTPAADLATDTSSIWPHHATLINFERVLGLTTTAQDIAAGGSGATLDFLVSLRNSIIYAGLIAAGQTLLCAMAGYAFARLRFRGRELLFGVFVMALMVPPIFTLLPNFALVKSLGWIGTFQGLIAPSLLMTPFAVFFLRQFFLSIPTEVEEAAALDGAGRWIQFWRVVLPMSRGPLFTIGLINAVWGWKDYLWPLLVGPDQNTRVLTAALGIFLQQSPNSAPDWTGLMAAAVLAVVPVALLLVFFGRRLVESLNFTGIK